MRHELHLLRRGLRALAIAAPALALVGAALGGARGLYSVLAGAGFVAVTHAAGAASTGWARVLVPKVVALGYAAWAVRMAGVAVGFAVLAGFSWVDRPLVASGFVAGLAVLLTAECWSYVRGSYVPSWRVLS